MLNVLNVPQCTNVNVYNEMCVNLLFYKKLVVLLSYDKLLVFNK